MDNVLSKEFQSIINALKKKHKVLYYLDLTEFRMDKLAPVGLVFRPLTRREFNFYSEQIKSDPIHSIRSCIELCTLYPQLDEYDWLGGIDDYIFKAITNYSGFQSEDVLVDCIEAQRKYANTLEAAMTMFICKAFPQYLPKDIEDMPMEEIVYLTSLSEQILAKELEYLVYLHPELAKKNQPEPKIKPHDDLLPKNRQFSYKNPKLLAPPDSRKEVVVTKENAAEEMNKLSQFLNG